MTARTLQQNRLFHALVRDVARARPMFPWRRPFMLEAWKRYFLGKYMREARLEAFAAGGSDPFPDRVARSSELASWQMDELIECTYAIAAQQLGLELESLECPHTVTQGRQGETGSWCRDCGVQAYAVDPRPCGDCSHIRQVVGGSICRHHLMAVVPAMNVTYKLAKGSCFALQSP